MKDYYESGMSYSQIGRKYGVSNGNVIVWNRKFGNKIVTLPTDIVEHKKDACMPHTANTQDQFSLSKEKQLSSENARLLKALEYSELRNEALNEVLKIGREHYGIDLLKNWRQSVDDLQQKHPEISKK